MKTQYKILLTTFLATCFICMFSFLKIDKKIISANISMSMNCMECVSDIKKNLYKGRDLGLC